MGFASRLSSGRSRFTFGSAVGSGGSEATGEQDMGFFSSILGAVIKPIASAVLGSPAPAPVLAPKPFLPTASGGPGFVGPPPINVQAFSGPPGVSVGGGKVFTGPQASADPQLRNNRLAAMSADTSSGGITGGNGATATRTLIQTVDLATGLITALDIRPGSPFLMNNDVRKIRGLSKKLLKAAGKVPRRTAKTTPQKQLTNAVIQRTLNTVLTGDAHHPHCP